MKRLTALAAILVMVVFGIGAELSVKSFRELPNDLDARANFPKNDMNGRKCAIIKVVTTESGFTFDTGQIGVIATEQHTAEIWVYVPEGTRKIKIAHPQLGQLSDTDDGFYWFKSGGVKSSFAYRLELISGKVVTTVVEQKKQAGFLVINSEPTGADVYLSEDGEEKFQGVTPFQRKLPYGSYNFRLKKPKYHDEAGIADIDNTKVVLPVKLRPSYGSISVASVPAGATVMLDGNRMPQVTPCTINEVASGSHNIILSLTNYSPHSQTVTVSDAVTSTVSANLDARFASVTVASLSEADIYVNGERKSTGTFNENLPEGIYDIEARLAHHRPLSKQIEVKASEPQTLTLNPTPIYGSLDVITTPIDATISINGKSYGTTPTTIENLLEGEYDVILSKSGCANESKRVIIREGETASVNATLQQGRSVSIDTGASGDAVYVDGNKVGISPCSVELSFGEHRISASREGKEAEKTISVTPGAGTLQCALRFVLLSPKWASNITATQKQILSRLIENMVKVDGGTFSMGATSEQGSDAWSMEKPIHSVTLSDYVIGKYEVTQSEWEAVMGKNPVEYDKGDNRPVQNISWNDCQNFISKLNKLTGLQFSLPTEAQWEYAARGGNKSRGYKYSGSDSLGTVAWYADNSGNATHEVGIKAPNELGLYDMSGNVWEWCNDRYGSYSSSSQSNPTGADSGSYRVLRGGSYLSVARNCRVSYRNYNLPVNRHDILGLRLSLVIH